MNTFNELKIKDEILRSLSEMGFTEPTPIQKEVIPFMLEGKDCLAQAPTGTGKTCAFGIPLANMTDNENESIQALIMCPTRELAMQTEKEIKKLVSNLRGIKVLAIYGGQNMSRQLANLRKCPQIVVGTPGRVLDHLSRHTLKLNNVKMVVLDEADEMLNMGFREDIDEILKNIKGKAQTVLFSATMSREILQISKNYQTDPVTVKTTLNKSDMPVINQYFVKLKEGSKLEALQKIMADKDYHFVLCFCNTKRKVDELANKLNEVGVLAGGLHGDLRQRQRDIMMQTFRSKAINILVATDVAARGIDVNDVEAVFNYDMPLDDEYYLHRIGRTARANKTGQSYSFATTKDLHRVRECERYTKTTMEELSLSGLSDVNISTKKAFDAPSVRFFMNLGCKDGLDDTKVKDLITENTPIRTNSIFEIKILDLFSFIEIDQTVSEELFLLNGQKYKKRAISIEKSEPSTKGRGNKSSSSRSAGRSYGDNSDRRGSRSEGGRTGFSRSNSGGEKRAYSPRPDGEKRAYSPRPDGEKRAYSSRSDGEKRAYSPRPDGEKRAYSPRPDGEKRAYSPRPDGEKRSYSSRPDGEKRSYSSRPDGEKRSYSSRPDGEKRAYSPRPDGEKRAYSPRPDGEKRAYSPRPDGEKRSYSSRPDGEKRAYSSRPDGEKRAYSSRPDGEKRAYSKPDGEKKSFFSESFKKEKPKSYSDDIGKSSSYSKDSSPRKTSGFKSDEPFRKSKTGKFGFNTKSPTSRVTKSKV